MPPEGAFDGAFTLDQLLAAARSEESFRPFCAAQRARPEADVMASLGQIPAGHAYLRVRFAVRCLNNRQNLEAVLREAVLHADATGMGFILGEMIPRVGLGRVFDIVEGLPATSPPAFEKALYWMARYARGQDRKHWPRYEAMLQRAEQMGIRPSWRTALP